MSNTPDSNGALLPCPWCGVVPVIEKSIDPRWAQVRHSPNCVVALNEFGRGRTIYISRGNWNAWNRRHASVAAVAGDAWLPIETAPRDGSRVLLGRDDFVWLDEWWKGNGDNSGWASQVAWQHATDKIARPPTHWMPLPSAPNAAGSSPAPASPQRVNTDFPFDDYCAGGDCRACTGVNCTCECHAPRPIRCIFCAHYGNVVDGKCREVGTILVPGGERGTICDCKCEFPAPAQPEGEQETTE